MSQPVELFIPAQYKPTADQFLNSYHLIKGIRPGNLDYSKKKLTKHTLRVCRFCGKRHPEASFSGYSHLVPKAIGNNYLYADSECNDCNEAFGHLEDDLTNYLGIARSFLGIQGEKRPFGFEGKTLIAKSRTFAGYNILIIAPEDIQRNAAVPGETSFSYTKQPFTPSRVYKALLKSALSVLPYNIVTNQYQAALTLLNYDMDENIGAYIGGYNFSLTINQPLRIYIWQKTDPSRIIPTHMITLHFLNNMFSIPVPLHASDMKIEPDKMQLLMPPPLFETEEDMLLSMPKQVMKDLSINTRITNERESITFIVNKESLDNMYAWNPETKTIDKGDYAASQPKYLILLGKDATINPESLSNFIKLHMENSPSN